MPTLTTRTMTVVRADLDTNELEHVLREYVHAPANAEVSVDGTGATVVWEAPAKKEEPDVYSAA